MRNRHSHNSGFRSKDESLRPKNVEEDRIKGHETEKSLVGLSEQKLVPISQEDVIKVSRFLGLGLRGRLVTVGVETTRKAALSGKVSLAVVALDASQHSKDKIVPLLSARGVTIIAMESARVLGDAVGRAATTVVGVLDTKLARGIHAACGEIGGRVE